MGKNAQPNVPTNQYTETIGLGEKIAYGGGYFAGSSLEQVACGGCNMSMEGDTVVVSISHRLNILGYLDLPPFSLMELMASQNVQH